MLPQSSDTTLFILLRTPPHRHRLFPLLSFYSLSVRAMEVVMEAAEDGILEQLLRDGGGGDGANFFPLIVGVLGPPAGTAGPDRVVLVNPMTQGMVVLEGDAAHLSDILADGAAFGGRGPPPASKVSIEALRTVGVGEGDLSDECSVCLEGLDCGGDGGDPPAAVVKEMPCGHRFHGGCIEKWLGIHGSCPVCRYQMPVEEEEGARKGGDGEEAGEGIRGTRREIWVTIAFGPREISDQPQGEGERADGGDEGEQQH